MTPYDEWRSAERLFADRDYYAAAKVLARMVADNPEMGMAQELLARSYFHSAQTGKALATAEAILERDPTNDYAHVLRVRALQRMSRDDDADRARQLAEAMGVQTR